MSFPSSLRDGVTMSFFVSQVECRSGGRVFLSLLVSVAGEQTQSPV